MTSNQIFSSPLRPTLKSFSTYSPNFSASYRTSSQFAPSLFIFQLSSIVYRLDQEGTSNTAHALLEKKNSCKFKGAPSIIFSLTPHKTTFEGDWKLSVGELRYNLFLSQFLSQLWKIEQKSERESYQHVCPPHLPGNRVRPCLLCFPRDRNPPRNINNVLLCAESERGGWGGRMDWNSPSSCL